MNRFRNHIITACLAALLLTIHSSLMLRKTTPAIAEFTCHTDKSGSIDIFYNVVPVQFGTILKFSQPASAWSNQYLEIHLQVPLTGTATAGYFSKYIYTINLPVKIVANNRMYNSFSKTLKSKNDITEIVLLGANPNELDPPTPSPMSWAVASYTDSISSTAIRATVTSEIKSEEYDCSNTYSSNLIYTIKDKAINYYRNIPVSV